MDYMRQQIYLIIIIIICIVPPILAGPFIDLETGPIFTGMNDARINGRYGTRFSLPGTYGSHPWYFVRAKAGWTIQGRHTIYLLAAPLSIDYQGSASRFILFRNRIFLPYSSVTATYKFNSWRLTYRYDIVRDDKIQFGIGLTGKIRDAYIRLDSMGFKTTRPDLGFVPLITVRLQWMFAPGFSALMDADWLVGPQGRAEDILFAVQHHVSDRILIKAGYRILEGGADNKKVYTFSLFHYVVFGTAIEF
jgi:hypothetical protein